MSQCSPGHPEYIALKAQQPHWHSVGHHTEWPAVFLHGSRPLPWQETNSLSFPSQNAEGGCRFCEPGGSDPRFSVQTDEAQWGAEASLPGPASPQHSRALRSRGGQVPDFTGLASWETIKWEEMEGAPRPQPVLFQMYFQWSLFFLKGTHYAWLTRNLPCRPRLALNLQPILPHPLKL